jgi:hypothetical protein
MTVYPLVFSVFGFQLTGFGIMMMLGFLGTSRCMVARSWRGAASYGTAGSSAVSSRSWA